MNSHLSFSILTPLTLAVAAACSPMSRQAEPARVPVFATTTAPDGLSIAYDVRGAGDVALVFVHCWSCNRAFWREQVDLFAEDHLVVRLDLGGHGDSGSDRDEWSILALARDVVAVVEALQLEKVVLVGHSMGGPVSLEAARLLPGRVLGIVAVDTLHDADMEFPKALADQLVQGFEADFESAMRGMFAGMSARGMDEELLAWILDEAMAANPEVAIALMKDFARLDPPRMFRDAGVPIRGINAAPGGMTPPTNFEGNNQYADFDAVLLEGAGHFLQLERPEEFNACLRDWLDELLAENG